MVSQQMLDALDTDAKLLLQDGVVAAQGILPGLAACGGGQGELGAFKLISDLLNLLKTATGKNAKPTQLLVDRLPAMLLTAEGLLAQWQAALPQAFMQGGGWSAGAHVGMFKKAQEQVQSGVMERGGSRSRAPDSESAAVETRQRWRESSRALVVNLVQPCRAKDQCYVGHLHRCLASGTQGFLDFSPPSSLLNNIRQVRSCFFWVFLRTHRAYDSASMHSPLALSFFPTHSTGERACTPRDGGRRGKASRNDARAHTWTRAQSELVRIKSA